MEKTGSSEAEAPLMTSQEKDVQVKNDLNSQRDEKQGGPKKNSGEPTYEPPDGGWGWWVVLANTICTMVMSTQGPCFGIFYGDRLRELGGTPTLAAWLFNFQSSVWNLAGPWAGPLGEKFTYRPVAMVSAFIAVSSLIVSAAVTNPYLLLLTFSVFSGIGGGICINCCYHMTAKYFKKHIGLANGIMVTGGSLGLMLMPQMASHLQQIYPFNYATLIAGAVMMNAVAVTALFHPVEWHTKKSTTSQDEASYTQILKTDEGKKPSKSDSTIKTPVSKSSSGGYPRCSSVPHHLLTQDAQKNHLVSIADLCRKRRASESPYLLDMDPEDAGSRGLGALENDNIKLSLVLSGSSSDMSSILTIHKSQQILKDSKDTGDSYGKCSDQGLWKKFLSHYKPSVLKDPLVICLALCTCITITSALNILSTMPFVLNDAGYSLQSAASAMSVAAIADLVTRLICAAVTDRSWVKPRILYGVAQVISIMAPLALVTGSNHWWVVVASMSATGVGLGILYVLDVFIIIRVLGVQKLQSVFGMSQLFRVVSFSTLGPVGGVLRDMTGSYTSSMIFYSCNILLGLLILIFTAFYTSCKSAPKLQEKDTVAE